MYRILLVDDSRVMRRMIRDMLSESGFADCEFVEAVDGQDALEKMAAAANAVDAVFCDLCMPNMDGIGFLDAVQSKADLRSCPVIILTADARNARGSEALRRGARALLAKPFTAKAVSATLKDVLEPREAGPAGGGAT